MVKRLARLDAPAGLLSVVVSVGSGLTEEGTGKEMGGPGSRGGKGVGWDTRVVFIRVPVYKSPFRLYSKIYKVPLNGPTIKQTTTINVECKKVEMNFDTRPKRP